MSRILLAALAACFAAAAWSASAQTPPPLDYADKANWLCLPGRADACAGDNRATVVTADGSLSVETWAADPKAPIDCFYVYPTVSRDPGAISDTVPGPEERSVAETQLSRFASKCRVFAPMYRQFTLTALATFMRGGTVPGAAEAFAVGGKDVSAAWNWYLENENHGRGVILIGHSQGSIVLTELIEDEIDGKPVQGRLISAILPGNNLPVAPGTGLGAFKSIPTCSSPTQTGCVIAYVSFRDTAPPPDNSRFGKPREPGMEAACVNPAALGGGEGALHAYLSSQITGPGSASPPVWAAGKSVTTPFVSVPGLLTARCVNTGGFSYLSIHLNADPADPRADDIRGDLPGPGGKPMADWGLHLIDVQAAMGNLVDLADSQGKAWLAKQHKH